MRLYQLHLLILRFLFEKQVISFFTLIQEYSDIELVNRNKGNGFQPIIKLSLKKFAEKEVFHYLSRFENDLAWAKAKIKLPLFQFDHEHNYLNSKRRIFESVKEIKYRMMDYRPIKWKYSCLLRKK
jgi:hypothetical protein